MEILAIVAVLGVIWWYIANNKSSVQDETVIKTTRTVKINGGEQTITRTTVMNNSQTDIRSPNTPMMPPDHKIIEPTERELELQRQLAIAQANQKALENQQVANQLPQKVKPKAITSQSTSSVQVKECSGCKRIQPVSEFSYNPNTPDKLTKWCNHCMKNGAPSPSDMKGTKVCEKCGQNRMKTSFYPTSKYPDGLSKWCKFCLPQRKKK